jgi:hypothetical protein
MNVRPERHQQMSPAERDRGGKVATLVALIAVALSTTAFLEVWHITQAGPGVSHDSADYLAAADSIRAGHGVTIPYPSYNELPPSRYANPPPVGMTTNPPLFPVLIAVTGVVSAQPMLPAARLLNALALALTVLIAGFLVWRRTRAVLWTSVAMSALVFQPDLALVSSMAWSETSTFVLLLAALLAMTEYAERPRTWLLVCAGAISGIAIMDRYVAIALVPVGLSAVWLARPRRRPLANALLFCFMALVPVGLWWARNASQSNGLAEGRHIGWNPPPLRTITGVLRTGYDWLSPLPIVRIPLLCALLTLAALAVTRAAGGRALRVTPGDVVIALFLPFCLLALVAAVTLFDIGLADELASPGLNHRLLTPVYVVGVVLVACAVARTAAQWPAGVRITAWAVATLLCVVSLLRAPALEVGIPAGFVYTTASWQRSATLELVKRTPAHDPLVTNAPDFVWFRTRRVAVALPRLLFSDTGKANLQYSAEISAINDAVDHGRRAWLALWNAVGRAYLPSVEQLGARLRLRLVEATADGSLFEILPRAARGRPPPRGAEGARRHVPRVIKRRLARVAAGPDPARRRATRSRAERGSAGPVRL